jgi:hypothetical protein
MDFVRLKQKSSYFSEKHLIIKFNLENISILGFAASVNSDRRVTLRDITYNRFHAKRFNGSWISDHEILFPDSDGGISLMNAVDGKTVQVRFLGNSQNYENQNVENQKELRK